MTNGGVKVLQNGQMLKLHTPLFEGHYQPRVPLDNNYYDLSDVETLKWQCKLAKDHGIYRILFLPLLV